MYNSNKSHWKKRRFLFFPFILAMVFGTGALIMFLWNAILPSLVHVSEINYWQSLGLLVLCRILFGGFRFGGRGGYYGPQGWREKYKNMSEEEKAALKAKWKERCGSWREGS
ncbi:MAG: hypothetical protein K0S32_1794 [Bacteroidetes bacterium]|jgi:hypothetical protein|nr:hypothetical protein [Bacteroidota bacterium]